MKKLIFYFAAAIALMAVSCKPNQQAYKQAYESAVAKRDSTGGLEGTIYNKYRDQARGQLLRMTNGDSLRVVTEYIGYTDDGGASRDNVKRYNIVVGKFKQVFNARQMRKRLQGRGYPHAFIIHTREPLYYVVTNTYDTAIEALHGLDSVKADTSMILRSPLPFVLQPAHLSR